MNLISKKPYRGVNIWLLGCLGYGNPYWCTYKQAIDNGGHVKKGEKGALIVFWKIRHLQQEEDSGINDLTETIPLLRYYKVFNVEQCDDVEFPRWEKSDNNPIERCEDVMVGYKDCPEIKSDLSRAFYSPTNDYIGMPPIDQFNGSNAYYSTLFHELTHSTGHKSRLDRATVTTGHSFGSVDYSKEELIAEMGASFLCNITGIDNTAVTKNNAAYLQGWLKRLKEDSRLIVQASSKAQAAVDYILGLNKPKELA